MPTITIDDKTLQVPDGTTVLQACQMARQRVPYYCYHPGLSIAGNCRICLVEIEGNPKLQISCNTRVADGMKVRTMTDTVKQAQKEVLEFLLINHPLDCPVCDQAGECELQNYYLEFGAYDPKFNEAKVKKTVKATPISKHIMLDMERCILCSRCVRFCDEVSKTGELAIFNRGDHAEIGIYPDKTLDGNKYAGNVADICPVGALTDQDFRFKCRVWYLGSVESVCPGCANGCNIYVHYNKERDWRPHIAQGERIMRLKPRYHADVNQWWMCDAGRYGYHFVDEQRLATPTLRQDSVARPTTWAAAVQWAANTVQAAGGKVGVIASTHLTNEDLFVLRRLFVEHLELTRVSANVPLALGDSDAFLMKADKSPNTAGARTLGLMRTLTGEDILRQAQQGEIKVLWVFGHDVFARFGDGFVTAALDSLDAVIFQGANHHRFVERAHLVLPSTTFVEKDGTFANFQGRVQRIRRVVAPLAQSRGDWEILQEIGQALGLRTSYASSAAVFQEMSRAMPAFAGMSYDKIGHRGMLLSQASKAELVTR